MVVLDCFLETREFENNLEMGESMLATHYAAGFVSPHATQFWRQTRAREPLMALAEGAVLRRDARPSASPKEKTRKVWSGGSGGGGEEGDGPGQPAWETTWRWADIFRRRQLLLAIAVVLVYILFPQPSLRRFPLSSIS